MAEHGVENSTLVLDYAEPPRPPRSTWLRVSKRVVWTLLLTAFPALLALLAYRLQPVRGTQTAMQFLALRQTPLDARGQTDFPEQYRRLREHAESVRSDTNLANAARQLRAGGHYWTAADLRGRVLTLAMGDAFSVSFECNLAEDAKPPLAAVIEAYLADHPELTGAGRTAVLASPQRPSPWYAVGGFAAGIALLPVIHRVRRRWRRPS